MNQVKQTVVALGVLALLAGCTGDDSTVSSSSNGYEVSSGLAQKGPLLRGSSVTVNELNASTLQPSGKSYTFEVLDDLGTFRPSNITFGSEYLESTALGYYFNELTGQQSSDMVYLRGLSYLGTDKAVNLNVLSSFVKNRVKNLVTTKPIKSYLAARPQAERELLGAFYIYNAVDLMPGTTVGSVTQPKTFMELDLSKKRAGDQILAAISGMVAQIGQTGSGVNYFLNQVETDLADDGLINNSPNFPVSVQQQLSDAAKSTDFGAVAANLNAFYKTNYTAKDLSQWVDTSGGVDKVIDKYKFSASNIPVGTESKSPEYVAGSEDAGQCFSVSAGKLYRNGVAVATGTVKAVKGDKFVLGLTGNAGGTTYSGFVQRSAPNATGVCPQVVPSSGLTRVEKYSIDVVSYLWNLSRDMMRGISSSPSFGEEAVWSAMYDSKGFSQNENNYKLMPIYESNHLGYQFAVWWNPPNTSSVIGVATQNITIKNSVTNMPVAQGVVIVHPVIPYSSIVRWKSPIVGNINIVGRIVDGDTACGNGVEWGFYKNDDVLAVGVLNNGGNAVDVLKQNISVAIGDDVYFIVSAKNDEECDSTFVDLLITSP